MALKSNEKRAIIIAGLATFLGAIFFAIAAGETEYYHAFMPVSYMLNRPATWTGPDVRVSYGPYMRCVKVDNADGHCDVIDRTCYPGIDITGYIDVNGVSTKTNPSYGSPLANCEVFNGFRAFHVIAMVTAFISGIATFIAAFRPLSYTLVVFLGLFSGFSGVISSVVGGVLNDTFNTSTFLASQPAISFDWGASFILSIFGWALTLASTGLYVAAKWDETPDIKQ